MKSKYLINILSLLFVFMGINSVTGLQYLIPTGQENKHIEYLLIGGIVNIILNCILIPKFMSIGAAIASVIGEAIIVCLELKYLSKTNQYNIKNIFKYIFKYLLMALIMFGIIKLVGKDMQSIFEVVIVSMLGGIIYFSLLILSKDSIVMEEIVKIKNKIIKVKSEG